MVDVPGYAILDRIGRGGFSEVYRATQLAFGRQVALKILTAREADPASVEAFRRECRAIGALSGHPNIVMVHDAGVTADGLLFIAMELAAGGSLRELIAQSGRLDEARVISIGVSIASALSTAHDAGITHRDVKPENVLLAADGTPKLADFGVARVADRTTTRSGDIAASLHHAAPEVLDGRPATFASDIYSFGTTLFTLAQGRPPFAQNDNDSLSALVTRIVRGQYPDLRSSGFSPPLIDLVELCMATDPADRPTSIGDVRARLEALDADGRAPCEDTLPRSTPEDRDDGPTLHLTRRSTTPKAIVDEPLPFIRVSPKRPPSRSTPRRTRWAALGVLISLVGVAAGVYAATRPAPGTRTGQIIGWGGMTRDVKEATPPTEFALDATISSISGDGYHALALADSGQLFATGFNDDGQLGDGTTEDRESFVGVDGRWREVDGGAASSAGIANDGSLFEWGAPAGNEPSLATPVPEWKAISLGGGRAIGIDDVGRLWSFDEGGANCCRSSLSQRNWLAADRGRDFAVAIRSDRSLWAWGISGKERDERKYGGTWHHVSAGRDHLAAIASDGTLWAWGDNGYGKLGDGTTIDRELVQIGSDADWTRVVAGRYNTFAIKRDGSLWGWGLNRVGQINGSGSVQVTRPTEVYPDDLPAVSDVAVLHHSIFVVTA